MRARTKTIEPDVLEVLKNVEIDGNNVRITQQLDRKLYVKTNDALVALGGKWNKKAKAHVFAEDPRAAIAAAVGGGTYESVKDAEKEAGYFPTPVGLAKRVVKLADIQPGDRVLEPSAGQGRLADEIRAQHPDADLYLCELLEGNIDALIAKGYPRGRICPDFLRFQPVKKFDRIVMNPPFAKQADIEHVTRAYGMLAPGGKLVSIMSPGFQYRTDKKATAFRELVKDGSGSVMENPEKAFHESGTDVRTVTIVLTKPGDSDLEREGWRRSPDPMYSKGDRVVNRLIPDKKGLILADADPSNYEVRADAGHRYKVRNLKTGKEEWWYESMIAPASSEIEPAPAKRKYGDFAIEWVTFKGGDRAVRTTPPDRAGTTTLVYIEKTDDGYRIEDEGKPAYLDKTFESIADLKKVIGGYIEHVLREEWGYESIESSKPRSERKSSRRSSKKAKLPNPWNKVGYFIGRALEEQKTRGPIPDLATLDAIDRLAEAQGNTAAQLIDRLKAAGTGYGGVPYALEFLMEGITPKLDKDLKLATGRTREEWLRVGNQMENRAADMDLDAMVREIDELIDRLEIPNARGFAVRIPQSKFYRKPPSRPVGGYSSDIPTRGEIENMLAQLRLEERVRLDKQFSKETKERLARQARTPDVVTDPATAAAMENVKRSLLWEGLPVRARRNVLRMIELGPLYAEFFGSTSEKVQQAAAKRLAKTGWDLSKIQREIYEGTDPWEWAKHEHKLNILAPDAFAKLTELEGKAWAADERKHADEPGRFLDAQDAYRILKDAGLTQTHTLADVADSPGFIGANDEIYVVLRDGEIALLEDTATPAKVERAEQTLRVIIPEDPDPFEAAAAPKPASVRRSSSRSEYREGGAEGMTADQIVTRTWTLDELEAMPTLATGHFDDLKIKRGDVQVWISRDDGQERNKVYVERLINGKWDEVRSYRATRKPASARKSSKKASSKAKSSGLDPKFQAALDGYIEAIRQAQKRFFKKDPVIGYEVNRKYIRVYEIKGTLDRSAHSFVDRSNGDIYKSDGWKRPAKHARGNIFRDPAEALDEMGFVVYLA